MRKVLVLSVLLVAGLAGGTGKGYIVVLKNGQRIVAAAPIEIQGKLALITLPSGTVTSLPLAQVDLVATERYNQLGLGGALVLEGVGEQTPTPTPTPEPSLGSLARLRGIARPSPPPGTPTPTPTPSITLRPAPYPDPRVTEAFTSFFEQKHLYLYKTSVGTRPDAFFVQVVTDSEREVFHALTTVAEAFALIRQLDPKLAPRVVELQLVTSVNKPAGTFRLTPELAEQLASGKVQVERFYIEHVIF